MGKKDKKGKKSKRDGAIKGTEEESGASSKSRKNRSRGLVKGKISLGNFEAELAQAGLCYTRITADGNCLFRALSDQLYGNEGAHQQLRHQVVGHIAEHADEFEPFLENDESLDSYVRRMRKDGVWAGHLEVQAASLVLRRNVLIFQPGQPCWAVMNHADGAPPLRVSYHDGEHYNSIVAARGGPPLPPAKQALHTRKLTTAREHHREHMHHGERQENGISLEEPAAVPCDEAAALTEEPSPVLIAQENEDGSWEDGEQRQHHQPQEDGTAPAAPPLDSNGEDAQVVSVGAAAPTREGHKGKCPCGSGKKWRKCCKKRVEAQRRAAQLSAGMHPTASEGSAVQQGTLCSKQLLI